MYDQTGALDFLDNTVAAGTDTIILRARRRQPACCPTRRATSPRASWSTASSSPSMLEGAQPVEALTIPRAAVLSDQQRRLCLSWSAPTTRRSSGASSSASPRPRPSWRSSRTAWPRARRVVLEGIQRVPPGPGASRPLPRRAPAARARRSRSSAATRRDDLRRLHPPAAAGHRHRHRHHHRRADRDDPHPGGAVSRHRAAAGPGHRQLSRRLGRGGRGRRRPADRGAGRRRRQDDLHEVDERQRRQLQPDRQLPARAPTPTSTPSTSTTGCRRALAQLPPEVQLRA